MADKQALLMRYLVVFALLAFTAPAWAGDDQEQAEEA
jgi:hypothetical protein